MNTAENLTEDEARALRYRLFGDCTELNWQNCKGNWMKPEEQSWLIQEGLTISTTTNKELEATLDPIFPKRLAH